jgi:hypothetical protein
MYPAAFFKLLCKKIYPQLHKTNILKLDQTSNKAVRRTGMGVGSNKKSV